MSFTAARSKPELVSPSRPTPRELKTLSACDTYPALRFYATGLEFFRCTGADDPAMAIKAALADALVYYYPMAGRLRELPLPGPGRKPQLAVDCTAEGAVFVEAAADVRLEDLGNPPLPPFPWFQQFVCDVGDARDIVGKPLVFLQVTRLSCGGFVVGISHCHTMADGFGIVQFLAAITDLARGDDRPGVLPVWERELLAARDPPRVTHRHLVFEPLPVLGGHGGDTLLSTPMEDMVGRCFFFGPGDVAALRSHVQGELGSSCTAFELIAAAMWRGRTAALACPAGQPVRLKFTMNARGRWKRDPPLPPGFYGNAFAWPAAQAAAGELTGRPLGHAVELLREAKRGMTDESMASMLDLFALRGGPPHVPDWTYVVSDISRLPTDGMRLGWAERVGGGLPMAGDALTRLVSFHMRCRNNVGEQCIVVSMFLPKPAMVRFAEEMTNVLSPNITVDDGQVAQHVKGG
ncbi:hypothetical protein BS78_05G212000 [Paspalum vaginatum]|nr:hypothetical protein BS78_05G212000 [Paspalum vaginatum]